VEGREVTPKPPQRRFSDLDVIRRAAVILTGDPDPVRAKTGDWLRARVRDSARGGFEDPYAAAVARTVLTELVSNRLSPACQPDCPTCHPAGGAA
jgi:hypothetical protein